MGAQSNSLQNDISQDLSAFLHLSYLCLISELAGRGPQLSPGISASPGHTVICRSKFSSRRGQCQWFEMKEKVVTESQVLLFSPWITWYIYPNALVRGQAMQEVVAVCSKFPCCCSFLPVIPCCTLLLQVFLQACLLEYLLQGVSLRGQRSK